MPKAPISISTIRDLADNDYSLALYCLPCDRWVEIDPAVWVQRGRGDIDYVLTKFRCRQCGEIASKQVRCAPMGQVANHGASSAGVADISHANCQAD